MALFKSYNIIRILSRSSGSDIDPEQNADTAHILS